MTCCYAAANVLATIVSLARFDELLLLAYVRLG